MDYEKKYRDLVEAVKELQESNPSDDGIQNWVKDSVPELRESEDEKIRKAIIEFFELQDENTTYSFISKKDIIAWLEKQGGVPVAINIDKIVEDYANNKERGNEGFGKPVNCMIRAYRQGITDALVILNLRKQGEQKETLCDKCRKEQPSHSCQDITALGRCALENQGEQKPADKVKPKFKLKKGKWYVCTQTFVLRGDIVVIKGQTYKSNQNGAIEGENKRLFIDTHDGKASEYFRPWCIQDAKDGDVLVTDFEEDNMIVMYHSMCTKDTINVHCCFDNKIICRNLGIFDAEDVKPATKNQRVLLFQKLKEAGYEWDAEKKELKKIEQTSAWSNTDLISLGYLAYFVDNNGDKFYGKNKPNVVKWIHSLANRTTPQQEWNEDDETMIESIINYMKPMPILFESTTGESGEEYTKKFIKGATKWLKSLKERYTWKPSEEQMDCLNSILRFGHVSQTSYKHLSSLINDLKKLKG